MSVSISLSHSALSLSLYLCFFDLGDGSAEEVRPVPDCTNPRAVRVRDGAMKYLPLLVLEFFALYAGFKTLPGAQETWITFYYER